MKKLLLVVTIGLLLSLSCQQIADLDHEMNVISAMVEKNFQAYLKGDAEEALEMIGNHFLQLSGGNIKKIKKDDLRSELTNRFDEQKKSNLYLEGKMISKSIRVSEEGQMAWGVLKFKVTAFEDSTKNEKKVEVIQVSLMVFEKKESNLQ